MPYGTFFATLDFVDRIVPRKGPTDSPFLIEVLSGLKRIAVVQSENPWVTIEATVSGGVWIYFQNCRRWLLNPTHHYLRVETAIGRPTGEHDLKCNLKQGVESKSVVDMENPNFDQWRVRVGGLRLVWEFIEALPKPTDDTHSEVDNSHPRYFPGLVREAALAKFESTGKWCAGVAPQRKRHRLRANEPREFDHILPHSRGGASTHLNIQILCVECNRVKGASAG